MKQLKLISLLAFFVVACAACKKGDTGAGPTGNANVVTGLDTITPSNWIWDATNKGNYVNIPDKQITSETVDSGTVSVFLSDDQSTWLALPLTAISSSSTSSALVTFNYSYSLNTVQITDQNTDLVSDAPTVNVYFKIIVITSFQRKANPKVNWKDYTQVVAVLNQSSPAIQ